MTTNEPYNPDKYAWLGLGSRLGEPPGSSNFDDDQVQSGTTAALPGPNQFKLTHRRCHFEKDES